MLWFPDTPLRRKLRLFITLPGAAVFFLLGLGVLVYEEHGVRERLEAQVSIAVQRVAENADDPATLERPEEFPLLMLDLLPGTAVPVVWDLQGNPSFPGSQDARMEVPPVPTADFGTETTDHGWLLVWRDLFDTEQKKSGTLGVLVDLRGWQERVWHRGLALVALSLVCALGLWGLAMWLEDSVSGPVQGLRDLQDKVEASENFGLRAAVETRDELGAVIEGYHEMLARLAGLSQDLRQSREREKEALRIKELYLAGISHEVRTPLRSILSYAEILHEARDTPARLAEDAGHLRTGAHHLLRLVDQILDLSRLESGRVQLKLDEEPVEVLVREVQATARSFIAQEGNTLAVHLAGSQGGEALGSIRADLSRCRQILLHLISYASGSTQNGNLTLEVWREVGPRCDRILFQLTDQGAGITPKQMETLFEPFAPVGDGSQGSLLGLAISRRFTRLMGGELSVASEPGTGSTFTLRLPAEVLAIGEEEPRLFSDAQEWPAGPAAGSALSKRESRPVALVLDDDPDSAEILEAMLGLEGFVAQCTSTDDDALPLARRLHPALVVLTVKVPPQRGWNLLSRIKADPDLAEIPVIVVSPLEERNKALDLGAVELLVKPLDRRRLASAVERCSGANGPVALVVEGDAAIREMLRRTLERVGWRVAEAENGVVGLRNVSEDRPSFVVLDLPLPALDGFSFLRELRKSPGGKSIAVLVLSNRRLTPGEERSVGPVVAVLEKGVWTLEEFRREVQNLARSQLQQS